ncbi:MAG: hypothetical protein P8Y94_14640 [Acidobacteriota bacterium]|jgi:hypothetical protein
MRFPRFLRRFGFAQPSTAPRDEAPFAVGFHGDRYLLEVVNMIRPHVFALVETGTNLGSTAGYVGRRFGDLPVWSCELDPAAARRATAYVETLPNVHVTTSASPEFLETLLVRERVVRDRATLFFLDAHGHGFDWPLKKELRLITENLDHAVVIIDDFRVPGRPGFSYGTYEGVVCDHEYIRPALAPRDYVLYCPAYSEHTSPHHPLVGYAVLLWGMVELTDLLDTCPRLERCTL